MYNFIGFESHIIFVTSHWRTGFVQVAVLYKNPFQVLAVGKEIKINSVRSRNREKEREKFFYGEGKRK